jgi:predicted Zn-dependent protease
MSDSAVDFNGIETTLTRFLKKTFSDVYFEYASAEVQIRENASEDFSQGVRVEHTTRRDIMARIHGRTDEGKVYFGAGLVGTASSKATLNEVLKDAKDNIFALGLECANDHKFRDSDAVHVPDMNFHPWVIDTDLIEDLRVASCNEKPKYDDNHRITTGYGSTNYWSIFVNTAGAHVRQNINYLSLTLEANMKSDYPFLRVFGFAPKNEAQVKQIYKLLPYLDDISEGQAIRQSRDCAEASRAIVGISRIFGNRSGVRDLPQGKYPVVTPSLTFSHECAGHASEEFIIRPRQDIHDGILIPDRMFRSGTNLDSSRFTLYDNPRMQLSGLDLITTREYDCEGFLMNAKRLINGGKVTNSALGSTYSKGRNVGNALGYTAVVFPIPRMSVIHTLPDNRDGPGSIEELCEMMDGPAVICNKGAGQVDPTTGAFILGSDVHAGFTGSPESYLYKNGKFIPLKTQFTVNGNSYVTIGNAVVGNKQSLSFNAGMCGSDNPALNEFTIDYVPSASVGPLIGIQEAGISTWGRRAAEV